MLVSNIYALLAMKKIVSLMKYISYGHISCLDEFLILRYNPLSFNSASVSTCLLLSNAHFVLLLR